jgi:hypothetical protein
MKVIYNRETDILTIILLEEAVAESDEGSLVSFLIIMSQVISSRWKLWMHHDALA